MRPVRRGPGQIFGAVAVLVAGLAWAVAGLAQDAGSPPITSPPIASGGSPPVASGGSPPAGAATAPVVTPDAALPTIKVHADSSGTLIPDQPSAPDATADAADAGGSAPQSGGFAPKAGTVPAATRSPAAGGGSGSALDYAGWDRMAQRAENAIVDPTASNAQLDLLRGQLVDWRQSLLGAQNANGARIATLKDQIATLGPAPAEGVTEEVSLATRRTELSAQLLRLQAPGIAATEAYTRADGLVGEIDRVLRERLASEALKLWPNPLYPGNWSDAASVLTKTAVALWAETAQKWDQAGARQTLLANLPVILLLLAFALLIFWRGRRWSNQLIAMLQGPTSARGRRIWGAIASLALIIVPMLGVIALSEALKLTTMLGPVGADIADNLGRIGFAAFAAIWLGSRVFPNVETPGLLLPLLPERRAEGRFLTGAFGVLLAAAQLRKVATGSQDIPDSATAVLNFPLIVIGSLLLFLMGRLIRVAADAEPLTEDGRPSHRGRLFRILSRAAMLIGLAGPVIAAVGYISAAAVLVFPGANTLALIAVLYLVQRLINDAYCLITRTEADQDALVPVLVGFALAVGTLPLLALIWGARVSDLTELWTRFQEGFQLGGTRISPTDFLFFAIVFVFGLGLTRLLQGTLKNSILPRTGMDQGGQNAVVSGLGYVGILISALVAINSTGIDLSGLAIVAGALSVGIGFGLQTIVSNFVSGIILLIERPISEGDWIEVGPVSGIVSSISVRSTRIQTFDRSDVIVPNLDLISGRVTNWTRFSLTGRLIVAVPVPFTTDNRKVAKILKEIAEAQPLVLLSPAPLIAFMGFTGEVMNFEIRVILRDVNFQVEVRSEINHQIAERFVAEGLVFTNAHRDYLKRLADEAAGLAEEEREFSLHRAAVAALLSETKDRAGGPTPPTAVHAGDMP